MKGDFQFQGRPTSTLPRVISAWELAQDRREAQQRAERLAAIEAQHGPVPGFASFSVRDEQPADPQPTSEELDMMYADWCCEERARKSAERNRRKFARRTA